MTTGKVIKSETIEPKRPQIPAKAASLAGCEPMPSFAPAREPVYVPSRRMAGFVARTK